MTSRSSFRRSTKGAAIAEVVTELRDAASWREIIVVDDGSTDETGASAGRAGATVIRHPYNKGNGAAVKTGIRAAAGDYVMIIDGDGQHQPADSVRLATGWATTTWSWAPGWDRPRPRRRAASATSS